MQRGSLTVSYHQTRPRRNKIPSPLRSRCRTTLCFLGRRAKTRLATLLPYLFGADLGAALPGQFPSQPVVPEILDGDTLYLEGEELKIVELGHTDTAHSTALYVPSIGLVVSGDAVYNNTHPYLAECSVEARGEWLRALAKIESLHPRAVVAGHGVLEPDSSPRHIEETRRYIRDFNSAVTSTSNAGELYEKMLSLYPDRVNPGSLWGGANAAKRS